MPDLDSKCRDVYIHIVPTILTRTHDQTQRTQRIKERNVSKDQIMNNTHRADPSAANAGNIILGNNHERVRMG